MSQPKSQRQLQEPPVKDPHHVRETYVNEVVSIELNPTGPCMVTFGIRRLSEDHVRQPVLEREVALRVVMTPQALQDLVNKVIGLDRALKQQQTLAAVPGTVAN